MLGESLIKTLFLPLAIFIIMFGMGMTLSPADFRRVIRRPKAKLTGLVCQLILLPLLALLLITLFGLSGELAVGMLLIAACPGGATSNILSHFAKGDTALSVSLTAVTSVITVFTIPLIVGTGLDRFLGADEQIPFRFVETVAQLFVVVILPILLGMLLHKLQPEKTRRMGPTFNVVSLVLLAIIIAGAVLKKEDLAGQFRQAGLPVFCLNLLTLGVGYAVAFLMRLEMRQRVTIAIESGIQNGSLALGIALGMLDNSAIAVPAVVYSLLMFGTGAVVVAVSSKLMPAPAAAEAN